MHNKILFFSILIFVLFISLSCSGNNTISPITPSTPSGDLNGRQVLVSPVSQSWWNTSVNVDGVNWIAHMDEYGRIARAIGKGVNPQEPLDFINSHPDLFGVTSTELIEMRDETHDGIRVAIFRQAANGIEVENTLVRVIYGRGGKIVSCGAETWPGYAVSGTWSIDESGAVKDAQMNDESRFISSKKLYYAQDGSLIPAWRIDLDNNSYLVNAINSSILETHTNRYEWTHQGHITGEVKPWSPLDNYISVDMYGVKAAFYTYDQYYAGQTYSGPDGHYTYESDKRYRMRNLTFSNPWIHVEEAWDGGIPTFDKWDWHDANYFYETPLNDSNSASGERNVEHYGVIAHDWLGIIEPGFNRLNFQLPAFVDKVGQCTAYAYCHDEPSIHFFQPYDICTDTGDNPSIIYHEYGHIYVSRIYINPSGALHEACADTFANCVSWNYTVGPDLYGAGTYRRVSNNQRMWPAPECEDEVHCVGNVLAGAFWNLRENIGDNLTDHIFHFSNYLNTVRFPEKAADIMIIDDDDDDITNGCPHYDDIYDAFYVKHNLAVPQITNPQTEGVVIDVVPLNLPHAIPFSGGGNFKYHLKVRNLDNEAKVKEIWTAFELPSGAFYGPVLPPSYNIAARPITLNLAPLQEFELDITQNVPSHVPPDTYYYHVRIGDFVDHYNDVLDDEGVLEVKVIN